MSHLCLLKFSQGVPWAHACRFRLANVENASVAAMWNAWKDHQEVDDLDVACNVERVIAQVRMHQASMCLLQCLVVCVSGQA